MSRISGMLDIGKRSLMNSQSALQTVGHNIANKSTEGYSRQRIEMQSAGSIGEGSIRLGMGARAADVTRVNNPYLEKQLLQEGGQLGYSQARADSLARVEQVYNEQSNRGLNKFMADFFNALRELSSSPENLASRTLVKETAHNLAQDFARVSNQLKSVQNDINGQVRSRVHQINEYAKEVASLNEKVVSVEISGVSANDERDRRDLLLKKMGEMVNIRWTENEDGMVSVSAGPSVTLVSGIFASELEAREVPSDQHRGGMHTEVFFKPKADSTPVKITEHITGGALGGDLQVRDHVVEELLNDTDELAFRFSSAVNAVHRQGFNRYNQQGVDLFHVRTGSLLDAAGNLSVDQRIANDVANIATAAMPGAAGDNRVVNLLAKLQGQSLMGNGHSSFDEFYNGLVGKAGVAANRALVGMESQKNVVKQLTNLRESISGVSLDEETTKMIEYQKAFDASARLIRAADEMLDTVLNIRR